MRFLQLVTHLRTALKSWTAEKAVSQKTEIHIEPLPYWWKASERDLLNSLIDPERINHRGQTFFPCPNISFIIDDPKDVVCAICKESQFELRGYGERLSDGTFAILPCGHAAGHKCMRAWHSANDTCPFCRQVMRYPVCGHKILPRLVTTDSIHTLPRTLPDKGQIPSLCKRCLKMELMRVTRPLLEQSMERFRGARARFMASPGVSDAMIDVLREKEVLELLPRQEVDQRYADFCLYNW